jgi:hypothetical protein
MRHTRLVIGAVAAVLLAGCGSSSPQTAPSTKAAPVVTTATPTTVAPTTVAPTTTSLSTTVAPTTTTTVPNPDLIPAVITPAYVDAVFKALDHIYGNVVRLMVNTSNIPPEATADLRAIFADPQFATELKIFSLELDQKPGDLRDPPGDEITTVEKLLDVSRSCIYLRTTTNYAPVLKDPATSDGSEYYALIPKPDTIDPENLNATAWAIFYNESFQTPTPPPADPCARS